MENGECGDASKISFARLIFHQGNRTFSSVEIDAQIVINKPMCVYIPLNIKIIING